MLDNKLKKKDVLKNLDKKISVHEKRIIMNSRHNSNTT
jgi:hypothetical protein